MALQVPTSPNVCFYTTWGKQNKRNTHWNEQWTSRNWRLDRIKFWSQRSELMKYIVYLLTAVLPAMTRSCFTSRAHQRIGSRSDRTVGVRNVCGPQQPWPQSGRLQAPGVMQEQVYQTTFKNVDELKKHRWKSGLVWTLEQNIVDTAINKWRKRLRACARAKGWHFEHLL